MRWSVDGCWEGGIWGANSPGRRLTELLSLRHAIYGAQIIYVHPLLSYFLHYLTELNSDKCLPTPSSVQECLNHRNTGTRETAKDRHFTERSPFPPSNRNIRSKLQARCLRPKSTFITRKHPELNVRNCFSRFGTTPPPPFKCNLSDLQKNPGITGARIFCGFLLNALSDV